jgi:hypothetical protein
MLLRVSDTKGITLSYQQTDLAADDNRFHEGHFHESALHDERDDEAKPEAILAEENFFAGAAARSELTMAAYRACIAGSSFGRHWSWEILLTVFAAGCAGETMSLAGAIGRLGAPYEFARRLVGVMVSEGSISMSDDQLEDNTSLSVTEHVFGALRSYLRNPARQALAF